MTRHVKDSDATVLLPVSLTIKVYIIKQHFKQHTWSLNNGRIILCYYTVVPTKINVKVNILV